MKGGCGEWRAKGGGKTKGRLVDEREEREEEGEGKREERIRRKRI